MEGFPDLSPRNEHDYVSFLWWSFSRRLAWVILAAAAVLSAAVLIFLFVQGMGLQTKGFETFHYDSWLLRFYSGKAAIKAKDGHIAYIGQVEKGGANGQGCLYDDQGELLYQGNFTSSRYDGKGTAYYTRHVKAYEGDYQTGARQGKGVLYNQKGTKIYQGNFQKDQILYEDFVGKTTQDLAKAYTGEQIAYTHDKELYTAMTEIHALYCAQSQDGTLEDGWQVSGVYVLKDGILTGKEKLHTEKQLRGYFGMPVYTGYTYAHLGEAAALSQCAGAKKMFGKLPALDLEQGLKNVYAVNGYDGRYRLYIQVYQTEGFKYTFFGKKKGQGFAFYLIEGLEN